MKPAEHQAVLRVLHMVEDYLELLPADTLIASMPGGLMTWGELRRHVGGAVGIMQANVPRAAGRNAWPGGRPTPRKGRR